MKKIILISSALMLTVQAGFCQWRSIEPSKAEAKVMTSLTKFTRPEPLPSFRDVVYARRSDTDLHLRIIRPDDDMNALRPCIVFIQGAAWFRQDLNQKLTYMLDFSRRGYVIAMVEHRPSTTATYPAQIQDVKSAVRYLRDNAGKTAPILIVTGNRDNVVPFEQSVIMADRLEEEGYDYKFYKIEGGDHGSWEFWTGEVSGIVDEFFKSHLKPTTMRKVEHLISK